MTNNNNNKKQVEHINSTPAINPDSNNKPGYYTSSFTKKSHYGSQQQPKPKMSNSLELLTGPIDSVQKKYEILSDIITEYQGKVHGSQSSINGNNISLIVYFEVPEGKREEVKKKFNANIVYTYKNYR